MNPDPEPEEALPFPSPGQATILTLFAGFLQGIFFLLLAQAGGARVAFAGIATIVAFGFVFALGAPRLKGDPAEALGFVPARTLAWVAIPFLSAALLLTSEINNIVLDFFPLPPEMPEVEGLAVLLEWGVVLVLVLPVSEELFFRGLVQPGLVERLGHRRGIALTALLDGLAAAIRLPHLLPEVVARALLLGFVRHVSGSLLPTLALAAVFGLVRLLAVTQAFGIPGFDDMSSPHTPLAWLAPAAILVGIGISVCRRPVNGPRAPDHPDIGPS